MHQRNWWKIGFLAVAGFVVLLIGGCSVAVVSLGIWGSTFPNSPTHKHNESQDAMHKHNSKGGHKTAQKPEQEQPEDYPEYGMNEPVPTSGGEVTVTGAEKTDVIDISYDKPIEGNFVIVEYEYTSSRSKSVTPPMETPFVLKDKGGNTYVENFDATNSLATDVEADLPLGMDDLSPGVATEGVTVFEISPEASEFVLGVTDPVSPGDKPDGIVNLELSSAAIEAPSDASASASASATASDSSDTSSDTSAAEAAVVEYYAAVAAGNWNYTYDHLTAGSQEVFTRDEWIAANSALGAGATYELTGIRDQGDGKYEVDILVNGSDTRTTYFYKLGTGSTFLHELTADEIELISGGLASATASASASAQ